MAKRAAPRRAAPRRAASRDIAREKYGTRPRLQKERRGKKRAPGGGEGEEGEKTGQGGRERERERERERGGGKKSRARDPSSRGRASRAFNLRRARCRTIEFDVYAGVHAGALSASDAVRDREDR